MTTIAEGMADPHVPWAWLLLLTDGEQSHRFASVPTEYDGHRWAGALEVRTPPKTSVDPYTGQCEACTADVILLPVVSDPNAEHPLRPCDELLPRTAGWRAELYRMPEGGSEAQLRLRGRAWRPEVDDAGALTLHLEDFTVEHNRRLSPGIIGKDTFADAQKESKGAGYPVLLGAFTDQDAPVTNVGAKRIMVSALGNSGTLQVGTATARLDDTADTVTGSSAQQDALGTWYWRASLTSDPGDGTTTKHATASSTDGVKDDTLGTYTGTPDAAITHPADQMRVLAAEFSTLDPDWIDTASFLAARQEMPDWTFSACLPSDSEDGLFDIYREAGQWLRSFIGHEGGMLRMRHLRFDRQPALHIIHGANTEDRGPIRWGDYADTASKITLKYDWRWKKKKKRWDYTESIILDSSTVPEFAVNEDHGAKPLDLDTRHLSHDDTAEKSLALIVELRKGPRIGVSYTVDRSSHGLREYDVVLVTDPDFPSADGLGISRKAFVVVEIEDGLESNVVSLLEV